MITTLRIVVFIVGIQRARYRHDILMGKEERQKGKIFKNVHTK